MSDPTAPLAERTPEQISAYIDDHIIMALNGADHLYGAADRQGAEDYIRDRLVAIADTYVNKPALEREEKRRRMDRIHRAIFGSETRA